MNLCIFYVLWCLEKYLRIWMKLSKWNIEYCCISKKVEFEKSWIFVTLINPSLHFTFFILLTVRRSLQQCNKEKILLICLFSVYFTKQIYYYVSSLAGQLKKIHFSVLFCCFRTKFSFNRFFFYSYIYSIHETFSILLNFEHNAKFNIQNNSGYCLFNSLSILNFELLLLLNFTLILIQNFYWIQRKTKMKNITTINAHRTQNNTQRTFSESFRTKNVHLRHDLLMNLFQIPNFLFL